MFLSTVCCLKDSLKRSLSWTGKLKAFFNSFAQQLFPFKKNPPFSLKQSFVSVTSSPGRTTSSFRRLVCSSNNFFNIYTSPVTNISDDRLALGTELNGMKTRQDKQVVGVQWTLQHTHIDPYIDLFQAQLSRCHKRRNPPCYICCLSQYSRDNIVRPIGLQVTVQDWHIPLIQACNYYLLGDKS